MNESDATIVCPSLWRTQTWKWWEMLVKFGQRHEPPVGTSVLLEEKAPPKPKGGGVDQETEGSTKEVHCGEERDQI